MIGTLFNSLAALLVGLSLWAMAHSPVGWRTDGTGLYQGVMPPTEWSEDKNIAWKVKLPGRSQGSPIVVDQRVFVVSDPAELLCLRATDGEILWRTSCDLPTLFGDEMAKQIAADFKRLRIARDLIQQELGKIKDSPDEERAAKERLAAANKQLNEMTAKLPSPPGDAFRETTNSAPTPISDGKYVYAAFGNGVVCAFTVTGEQRWVRFVQGPTIGFGHCSSPLLADGKLIIHYNDILALDCNTGEVLWQTPLSPTHGSPIMTELGGTRLLVSPAGAVVRCNDGKVLLRDNSLLSSECSPVIHDGVLYSCSDSNITAAKMVSTGVDAVKLEILWRCKIAGGRRTPSPVCHQGLVYCVNTDGILDAVDASTGKATYKKRLNLGAIYSSTTAAGDYLFASGTNGETVVIAAGDEYREVARSKLEGFGSSPVFAGRRMLVRTQQHLYCIEQPGSGN